MNEKQENLKMVRQAIEIHLKGIRAGCEILGSLGQAKDLPDGMIKQVLETLQERIVDLHFAENVATAIYEERVSAEGLAWVREAACLKA